MRQIGAEANPDWLAPKGPALRRPAVHPPKLAAERGRGAWPLERRPAGRSWYRRVRGPVAAALAGMLVFAVLSHGGRNTRAGQFLSEEFEDLSSLLGLRLDQVSVSGHRFTADGDIFDALDLANARTLLTFDSAAARERIERLPWVATATIARVLPGRLDVRVTERRPYAVWRRGEREYLIDETGRVLGAVQAGAVTGLPRIAGDGAPAEAPRLMATLARFPAIAERVELAQRVAGRRWTLMLKGNVELRLAPDREMATLARFASGDLAKLLETPNRLIDARVPQRIAVRGREEAMAAAAPLRSAPEPGYGG